MTLYADGVRKQAAYLSAANQWKYTWNLPKYDDTGAEIRYTVQTTTEVAEYVISAQGTTLTFSHRSETLVMNESFEDPASDNLSWATQFDVIGPNGPIGYWTAENGKLQMHYTDKDGIGTSVFYNKNLADLQNFRMTAKVFFGENSGKTRWMQL